MGKVTSQIHSLWGKAFNVMGFYLLTLSLGSTWKDIILVSDYKCKMCTILFFFYMISESTALLTENVESCGQENVAFYLLRQELTPI